MSKKKDKPKKMRAPSQSREARSLEKEAEGIEAEEELEKEEFARENP